MRRHNYEQFMKDSIIGLLKDCVYFCSQYSEITDDEDLSMNCFLNSLYEIGSYKEMKINRWNEVDIPEFMKKDNVIKFERRKDEI